MRMYIVVKKSVPAQLVPVITAHASLACYKRFEKHNHMVEWINGIFKKIVWSVSEKEFEALKEEQDNIVLTESALDNQQVCIAFCPRPDFPKKFKFLRMWKPSF